MGCWVETASHFLKSQTHQNELLMNKLDREEMRQLLTDVLSAHTAEIGGQFQLIKQELGQIKEQTIKTNGRVNRHDEELQNLKLIEKDHFVHCPNSDRLDNLETLKEQYVGAWNFIIKAAATFSAIALIAIAILELIIKK